MKKLVLFLCILHSAMCVSIRTQEKQILDQILAPDHYDIKIRPPGLNSSEAPVIVRVNLFVRSIDTIDDLRMEYNTQLTFRQQWLDKRLQFNNSNNSIRYLTVTDRNQLWVPDLFFSNEKKANFHNLMIPNLYFRIFPDGNVLYSTRLSLTLSCPMNLKNFPMDYQICTMRMASCKSTLEHQIKS